MDKRLLLGNEAVARGIYEAGCALVSSYPGTPSTEITEFAVKQEGVYAEWAPNEKVAVEVAYGACVAGVRAFSGMKHVGLNVAADPVFTAAYTGVGGGLVIAVADDPGMHSSQNEQDSRHYANASKIPMLEPSDSQECKDFTKLAFTLSEQFDTPVFVRLTTRVSHSQSVVSLSDPEPMTNKGFAKNPAKYVMVPANARLRHALVEQHMQALTTWAEKTEINRIVAGSSKIGVIAAGIAYQTAREALGDQATYLKLGMVHPLPMDIITKFASQVDTLYILEELDDVIETHCRKLGIPCQGKQLFSVEGEYSAEKIRHVILGTDMPKTTPHAVPNRPPVLCPGCPHRGAFHVLNKMKLTVSGDIGCYTLGAAPPLSAMDLTLCMGASISALHGILKADPTMASRTVAVIGDSTFLHSGMTGLLNIVYNQSHATVLILDNAITGMTGHQQNPATGLTLGMMPAPIVDLEQLCRALGVANVVVVDPHDMTALEQSLTEQLAIQAPSVIIARRPCVLLPTVPKQKPMLVGDSCKNCNACMRIGCPAMQTGERRIAIDPTLCTGCGLCQRLCRFGALGGQTV